MWCGTCARCLERRADTRERDYKPALDVHSLLFREVTIESSLAHVCDQDLRPALAILAEGPWAPSPSSAW